MPAIAMTLTCPLESEKVLGGLNVIPSQRYDKSAPATAKSGALSEIAGYSNVNSEHRGRTACLLLQLHVLHLGFLEDGDVGVTSFQRARKSTVTPTIFQRISDVLRAQLAALPISR
jgi:hypothetical protein